MYMTIVSESQRQPPVVFVQLKQGNAELNLRDDIQAI